MEEVKVELKDLSGIRAELLGIREAKIKGVLNEKINIKQRYWLDKSVSNILKEIESLESTINTLIKKYGDGEDGKESIQQKIKVKGKLADNPKFTEYIKEYNELIGQSVDVKIKKFDIEEFDFDSDVHYHLFLKYFIKEDE